MAKKGRAGRKPGSVFQMTGIQEGGYLSGMSVTEHLKRTHKGDPRPYSELVKDQP